MGRLKRFIHRNIYGYDLTPKGECLRIYVDKLSDGTLDSRISAYDEMIYKAQSLLESRENISLSFQETAELMSAYFSEYY